MFDSVEQSFIAIVLGLLLGAFLFSIFKIRAITGDLHRESRRIVDIFHERADKIPALIESIRRYDAAPHAFDAIMPVYERAVLSRTTEVYQLLGLDRELSRELSFLLRFALHVDGLGRDGHFIAVRDFLVYYERAMTERLREYNKAVRFHNRLVRLKNFTVLGLFVPIRDLEEVV
ncbi:MAG TPA: hypothetical protein PK765_06725 [bacterium]|nr:hypothetical protein [bacterium]